MNKTLLALLLCPLALPVNSQTTKTSAAQHSHAISSKQAPNGKHFTSEPLNDEIFKRIQGKSYKAGCTIPRTELRYLRILHYNAEGNIKQGELICHRDIADDLIDIFRRLYEAHYPIERMQLIDDYNADDELSMSHNNTSCFNFRRIAGSKKLSYHSQGKAIDINPLYNPCVKHLKNGCISVSPKQGRTYSNRSKQFKYKIDRNDLAYKLFIQHGFTWGGSWKTTKDYQHFEKQN